MGFQCLVNQLMLPVRPFNLPFLHGCQFFVGGGKIGQHINRPAPPTVINHKGNNIMNLIALGIRLLQASLIVKRFRLLKAGINHRQIPFRNLLGRLSCQPGFQHGTDLKNLAHILFADSSGNITLIVASLHQLIPLKHMGKPEDIANLAVFLAGDGASYITGEVIRVDGGLGM